MTLTYLGGERVVPHYNVMGVAKAALEMSVRYLAADLGPKGIRVNAISAGPDQDPGRRRASTASRRCSSTTAARAPAPQHRPGRSGRRGALPGSKLSRGVTGEVIHVDGGFHVMGMAAL